MIIEKEKTEGLVKTVTSAQAGNIVSYENLYKDYYYYVWKIAYEYFRNNSKAEDVVQEVFLIVYKNLHNLENPGLFVAWLRRITYNACHKMFTKEKSDFMGHINIGEDEKYVEHIKQEEMDIIAKLEEEDIKEIIFESIQNMKKEHRIIGYLRFRDGLSYNEISTYTGLPLGTVAVRIKRIKEKLQKELKRRGIDKAGFLAIGIGPAFSKLYQEQINNILKVPQKVLKTSMQSLQMSNLIAPIMTLSTVVVAPMAVTTYQEKYVYQEISNSAAIQEIAYDETITNKPIPLDIKIINGEVDKVLLDGQENLIINENGVHTIELYKDEQRLETKQFVVTNIDREKPDVIETETDELLQFKLFDNQKVDYQNIKMYINGEESKDYQLHKDSSTLTIMKELNKKVSIIIPDFAGNKLVLDVNFYEINKKI